MEIVVDAYTEDERVTGWYCFLEENLKFVFTVRCIAERVISPLRVGDEVEVIGMAPIEECEREMFVEIEWLEHDFAAPLSQLEGINVDAKIREAIEDWRYWFDCGYRF